MNHTAHIRFFRLLSVLCTLALLSGAGCSRMVRNNRSTIKILHVNDIHSFLDPEEIDLVLEDALEYMLQTGADGAFPYAYGLKYDVDATRSYGHRVSGLEVKNRATGRYTPLSDKARYVVLTSNYLADGRDGYTAFAEARNPEGKGTGTYLDYALAFVDYVKELTAAGRPLESLPAEDHCIKIYVPRETGKSGGS